MAAGKTYDQLFTTTLTSAVASLTISSIPSAYTDIIMVFSGSASASDNLYVRFNSDTATNYGVTELYGNGTTASASRRTSFNAALIFDGGPSTTQSNTILHLMNYSNTTTYKTGLARANDSSLYVNANVISWKSTAAINSITIGLYSGATMTVGSSVTLYGIVAA